MPGLVVALLLQIVWTIARAVLEHEGFAAGDPQVVALSVGCLAASYVTLAAASRGLARRLAGKRRLGAWLATIAFLVFVAAIALYEALIRSSAEHPHAMSWAIAVRVRGWSVAEAVAILGLALAGGPRGYWLAPPTIGLALLGAQPGLSTASWSPSALLVLLVAKAVLVMFIAAAAEGGAAPIEHEPERASLGLRRGELCTWVLAALSPIWALAWFATPTIYVALASAFTSVTIATLFASAAWSIARAAIPESPRWLWYASAMFTVCGLARTVRSWSVTLVRHWGDLEATPLKTVHWSAAIPGLLAALSALGAFAVLAHRTRMRELMRAAAAAAVFSALAFSVECALPGQTVPRVICYLVANLAAVHAYRVARSASHAHVPRAQVV